MSSLKVKAQKLFEIHVIKHEGEEMSIAKDMLDINSLKVANSNTKQTVDDAVTAASFSTDFMHEMDYDKLPVYSLNQEGTPFEALNIEPRPYNLAGQKSVFASTVPVDNFAPFLNKGDMIYLNPEELAYPGSLIILFPQYSSSFKDSFIGRVTKVTKESMTVNLSSIDSDEITIRKDMIKSFYPIVGWVRSQSHPKSA